ncbi:MAG: hypothetical protein ACOC2M_04695 [bacterium]
MKVNWKKVLLISVSEEEYFNDPADKIEFAGCKKSAEHCLDYLPQINEYFRESDKFHRAKDFHQAIDALKNAYDVAKSIREPDCQRCVMFFKATVIQSLENIHFELVRMGKGIFATKRYQPSCVKAEKLLIQLKTTKEVKPEYHRSEKRLPARPAYSLQVS